MTHLELKTRIDQDIPFTLHVADGRSFLVPHRDFVWLLPRSTIVMVAAPSPENKNQTVAHTIPLLMISGVSRVHDSADL